VKTFYYASFGEVSPCKFESTLDAFFTYFLRIELMKNGIKRKNPITVGSNGCPPLKKVKKNVIRKKMKKIADSFICFI